MSRELTVEEINKHIIEMHENIIGMLLSEVEEYPEQMRWLIFSRVVNRTFEAHYRNGLCTAQQWMDKIESKEVPTPPMGMN